MNNAQRTYIRDCYRNYKESLGTCERCGPDREPIYRRWANVVNDVVDYVNGIAPATPVLYANDHPTSDIVYWKPGGHTWGGGVFECDGYDSVGPPQWYWRLPGEGSDQVHRRSSPALALLEMVNAFEETVGADPMAPTLVFTVRLPWSCADSGHEWEFTGTGRHGSDKGVDHYKCLHCPETKKE